MKFLVINGPNLNMMHFTEPGVAGQLDYNGLLDYLELCCTQMGMEVEFFQSNHEGDLIDEIQSAAGRADGIILNPGGYAHYSVAILDALRLCGVPAVEVLLSEPDEHEPFRKTDIVSFGCQGHFIGEGINGYLHAAAFGAQLLGVEGRAPPHLVIKKIDSLPLESGAKRAWKRRIERKDFMIISTKKGAPKEELEKIVDRFEKQGLDVTLITGKDYNVFGLVGDTTKIDERDVLANPWIDNVTRVSAPYKRANRLFHPADSVIDCGGVKIGGKEKIAVMAGPCSIESEEQALRIAQGVKAGGATLFRGGAYKPRTSPYSFQGLETEGILDMVKAREATGMPIVSELMSEDRIPEFEEYVDVVQIGARNMQNFQLLKAVGKMHKPVLLKRGLCNTIEEWIMSAEYIMAGGNEQVILCERGIRTFEKYTRNTLDLSAVPIIHEKTHLPVIVDPSHATGKANLVEPMMIAAVAAGADGLEVEVHYDPRHAWSDGAQCLTPDAFAQAMAKCRQVAWAIGRDM